MYYEGLQFIESVASPCGPSLERGPRYISHLIDIFPLDDYNPVSTPVRGPLARSSHSALRTSRIQSTSPLYMRLQMAAASLIQSPERRSKYGHMRDA